MSLRIAVLVAVVLAGLAGGYASMALAPNGNGYGYAVSGSGITDHQRAPI